jgi:hypothetical protein
LEKRKLILQKAAVSNVLAQRVAKLCALKRFAVMIIDYPRPAKVAKHICVVVGADG